MAQLVVFVMDLETGTPARGVGVTVTRAAGRDAATGQQRTGPDGCARFGFAPGAAPAGAGWRVELDTGAYFEAAGKRSTFPQICVDFNWDGAQKMVLPVLISAHGYTVYRGH